MSKSDKIGIAASVVIIAIMVGLAFVIFSVSPPSVYTIQIINVEDGTTFYEIQDVKSHYSEPGLVIYYLKGLYTEKALHLPNNKTFLIERIEQRGQNE